MTLESVVTVMDTFVELLERCIETRASDLHLSGEMPPYGRVHGLMEPIGEEPISAAFMEELGQELMNERQRKVFEKEQTIDMAYTTSGGTTFRINMFRERGRVAMVARRLDDEFRTIEQLHLPPQISEFADLPHGLVLITGATGSGKSTTLATLIHQINCTRPCHIITVEDPMEYVHHNIKSVVHQRELFSDVPTFADAVRAALREDPDVILIGEMRDLDTMRAAITAAETGHLVFSTLHSGDAIGAVDRMIGVFPADEQESIRHQLSGVLRGVVAQKLVRERSGQRRVPCVEILRVNTAVANLIRRGDMPNIRLVMETGGEEGMYLFDECLAELVAQELVDLETARGLAHDLNVFESRFRNALQRLSAMRAQAAAQAQWQAQAQAQSQQQSAQSDRRNGFWSFGRGK